MKGSLERLKEEALVLIDKAPDEQELISVKARYLGKKGEITAIMKGWEAFLRLSAQPLDSL